MPKQLLCFGIETSLRLLTAVRGLRVPCAWIKPWLQLAALTVRSLAALQKRPSVRLNYRSGLSEAATNV